MKNVSVLLCIVLSLCLSLSAANTNTDNVSLSWGAKFKLPAKSYELGFIGNQSAGYIDVSHMKGRSLNLQKFDPELNLTSTQKISTKYLGKKYTIEGVVAINNKYYLHYSKRASTRESLLNFCHLLSK
jgi:hypothetical protein